VIDYDKINLPVCAFGAGLTHVAALALILPIVISLPAPADTAPQAIAIHVEIRTATPESARAEADAEDIGAPLDALGSEEVTAALPAPVETEELDGGTEPAAPQDALAPEPEPGEDVQPSAVANVDANEMPSAVPLPLRKPKLTGDLEARPAPQRHVVSRVHVRAKPVSKRFLGGRPATPMPEYPSEGQLQPNR
jgi:hypothetical protein